MTRLRPPTTVKLEDPDAESVRRNLSDRITELQRLPFAGARIIRDVELPPSVEVTIRHGLGRAPLWVGVSVLRNPTLAALTAGFIDDLGSAYQSGLPIDRTKFLSLVAFFFGATITVDLVVL